MLLATGAGIFGFRQIRILWAIVHTKTTSIGALPEGLREVKGRIVKSGGPGVMIGAVIMILGGA